MYKEIKEYIEVVDALNEILFDENLEAEFYFSLETTTYFSAIKFMDYVLWCSENDERKYIEEIDDYEPLLGFCQKEFNKYADRLHKLKF